MESMNDQTSQPENQDVEQLRKAAMEGDAEAQPKYKLHVLRMRGSTDGRESVA